MLLVGFVLFPVQTSLREYPDTGPLSLQVVTRVELGYFGDMKGIVCYTLPIMGSSQQGITETVCACDMRGGKEAFVCC